MIVGWLTIYYKNSSKTKPSKQKTSKDEYIPFYMEDDYCMLEIVPKQNMRHILAEMGKPNRSDNETSENILTDTEALELRTDYVTAILEHYGFKKASKINYEGTVHTVKNCLPFGFPNFTIFVDINGELVKVLWLRVHGLIMHVWQREAIRDALYELGSSSNLILANWHQRNPDVYDLSDKNDIERFLQDYWK